LRPNPASHSVQAFGVSVWPVRQVLGGAVLVSVFAVVNNKLTCLAGGERVA